MLVGLIVKWYFYITTRKLREASQKLEKSKRRNHLGKIVNAKAIKGDLEAVWKGIDRAMANCGVIISLSNGNSSLML